MLSWLHFGDLHITTGEQRNYRDLQALVADANRHLSGIDFAVLPGDNADDGAEAQLRLVRAAMDRLNMPLHVIPGDHDFKSRTLNAYRQVLDAEPLPRAITVKDHRCLFLDIVSAGSGGPDFRLGAEQMGWLRSELARAKQDGLPIMVFMHAYPDDLHEGVIELKTLFTRHRVAFVDTGHTHYNELANDGTTIFAATRSTGQIEEGLVGFSIGALDEGMASWRFKTLEQGWPFVILTAPADHRLITEPGSTAQLPRGDVHVRARAWSGDGITAVRARISDGAEQAMVMDTKDKAEAGVWQCSIPSPTDGLHELVVKAEDKAGGSDEDRIMVRVSRNGAYAVKARDGQAIAGAWPEKGIPGTQLGPNKNGRKW
jgi:Icc protein